MTIYSLDAQTNELIRKALEGATDQEKGPWPVTVRQHWDGNRSTLIVKSPKTGKYIRVHNSDYKYIPTEFSHRIFDPKLVKNDKGQYTVMMSVKDLTTLYNLRIQK